MKVQSALTNVISQQPEYITVEEVADAIDLQVIDVFDVSPDRTKNPFSYFTQTAFFAFLDVIRRENEELAIKYRACLHNMHNFELSDEGDDSEESKLLLEDMLPDTGFMTDFVAKFEANLEDKRERAKKYTSKGRVIDDFFGEKGNSDN